MKYIAGLDLGQRADYSCLCVAEHHGALFGKAKFNVIFAKRWRGTSYVELVAAVAGILNLSPFNGKAHLRLDGTGVGVAVTDLFNSARADGVLVVDEMTAITATAGTEANPRKDTVPKKDLIAALEVAITQKRLKFAKDLALAASIRQELKSFQAGLTRTGRPQFEAAGGHHDDIVTALALITYEFRPVLIGLIDYDPERGELADDPTYDPLEAMGMPDLT